MRFLTLMIQLAFVLADDDEYMAECNLKPPIGGTAGN